FGNGEIHPENPNFTALAPLAVGPGLVVTNIGCRDWTGSLAMTKPVAGGQETLTLSNIVLRNQLPTAVPPPGSAPTTYPIAAGTKVSLSFGYTYATTAGTATWTYNGATTGCTRTGNKTFSVIDPTPKHQFSNWAPPGKADHGASVGGFLGEIGRAHV